MAKRNINPRKGLWTLPAGFMENAETLQDGALRETFEETGWKIQPVKRLGFFHRFVYMPEYRKWAQKVCHICRSKGLYRNFGEDFG